MLIFNNPLSCGSP